MLPGQMSLWQLESVLDVPRNLCLKFHQNRVSNSWDIVDIEFVWLGGEMGWVVFAKSFSRLTQLEVISGWVELGLSWGFHKNWTLSMPYFSFSIFGLIKRLIKLYIRNAPIIYRWLFVPMYPTLREIILFEAVLIYTRLTVAGDIWYYSHHIERISHYRNIHCIGIFPGKLLFEGGQKRKIVHKNTYVTSQ